MRYEQRPWLATVPWCQVIDAQGLIWTVLPHWPTHERRVTRPGAPLPAVFAPRVMDMCTVLIPDEPDALQVLAAVFGMPEVIAWKPSETAWWAVPQPSSTTVDRHLRDWHGRLDRWPRDQREALTYHWQLHQQQLVHPLPNPHTH